MSTEVGVRTQTTALPTLTVPTVPQLLVPVPSTGSRLARLFPQASAELLPKVPTVPSCAGTSYLPSERSFIRTLPNTRTQAARAGRPQTSALPTLAWRSRKTHQDARPRRATHEERKP